MWGIGLSSKCKFFKIFILKFINDVHPWNILAFDNKVVVLDNIFITDNDVQFEFSESEEENL